MSGCRIGKVTLKGGAGLSVMPTRVRGLAQADIDRVRASVDTIAGFWPGEVGGFAVVGWSMDGSFSRCTRMHVNGPVGQTLMPGFVAEILRRDIADEVVREVLG